MALSIPIAIWTIPIFDVLMAILRRKLTGRSIYATDRGHIHHVFQQHGFSHRKILFVIATLCLITCTGAFVGLYRHNEWVAYGSTVVVLLILVISRSFGHAELKLLIGRTRSFASSLIPSMRNANDAQQGRQVCARIQGTREWDELWRSLVEYACRFEFTRIRLNVNIPQLHEEFHADWQMQREGNEDAWWSTSLPICVNGVLQARLMIAGLRKDQFDCQTLSDLVEGLKPFETQMIDLIEDAMAQLSSAAKVPEPQVIQEVVA
jgi:UDP-GlcNAc:undecaprenyl-phosphate GlcNAc-1-phosphate transferase